jgi:hypothetical protein
MARKLDPLTRFNKDVAEHLFGPSPGRPTVSGHVGKHVGRALGIGPKAGKNLFHGALGILGALALAKKFLK